MTLSEQHKQDLAALKGIHLERVRRVDNEGGFEMVDILAWRNQEADLSYLDEPGLRILPAEDKPLNPTLLRWNKNCER